MAKRITKKSGRHYFYNNKGESTARIARIVGITESQVIKILYSNL